jgi:hypothetical protein
MLLSDFPVEILVQIFAFTNGSFCSKSLQMLYMALFCVNKITRCKLDTVLKSLHIFVNFSENKKCVNIDRYIKIYVPGTFDRRPNFVIEFFKYATLLINLEEFYCGSIADTWNIQEKIFTLEKLKILELATFVNASDLLKLPLLTKLTVERIFSDTYTEKLNIRHLSILTKYDGGDVYTSGKLVALPYSEMFSLLETLNLKCLASNCEDKIILQDCLFLTKFIVDSIRSFEIVMGKLDNLEKISISGNCIVNFLPRMVYSNLKKFDVGQYPSKISWENFEAKSSLMVNYSCIYFTTKTEDRLALTNLGQQYQMCLHLYHDELPSYSEWNVKYIWGLDSINLQMISKVNPAIFSQLVCLNIVHIPVGSKDKLCFLENATSLKKVTIQCRHHITEREMCVLVKIPTVKLFDFCGGSYDKLIIEMFCKCHEFITTHRKITKYCKKIICDVGSSQLAKYAKEADIIYRVC